MSDQSTRKHYIHKRLWGEKAPFLELFSWRYHRRPPSSERANIVWHLQWCWSLACTCCSAVGPLPRGRRFSGNRKRAKRPSVINGHVCAAQNTTGLSAAIFLTHGPTGWELRNRSVKLLMLILNCFGSSVICVSAWPRMTWSRQVASQSGWDSEWFALQDAAILLLTNALQFTSQDRLQKESFIPPP